MTTTDPVSVLDIDVGAVVANWRALHARHPCAAVVKADAYGLGAAAIAPHLLAAGCRHFFTAHLAEAVALRPLLRGAMLAALNGLTPGTEADYLAHDVTPVLNTLAQVDAWAALARQVGRSLPAVLHVDTGMNRLGLEAAEVDRLAADPGRLGGIALRYVMTHLCSAELPEDPMNARQAARFGRACARLPAAPRSLANSSGLFLGPDFASDLARPGAALFGINPTPGRPHPLRSVVRLRARVLQVREVPQGETVGYNGRWRAARPSRVATVAAGYADGWPRALSGRGHALFDGRPAPLVGRVSMDLTTYDVTDHPAVREGAWLEMIGDSLDPEAVAATAGTNDYEILTSLGARYTRVYHA